MPEMDDGEDRLLRIGEVAEMTGLSKGTIYALMGQGLFPLPQEAVSFGRKNMDRVPASGRAASDAWARAVDAGRCVLIDPCCKSRRCRR